MTKVPNVKLSDGNEMPIIGLGTYKSKPVEVLNAVKVAIDVGYRHFDCALIYQNENEVGQAIKEKIGDGTVKREDIFVTSKAGNELFPVNEKGEELIENVEFEEIWKGMEDCYENGLVKSIGLSNFNSEQIKSILSICRIKPTVLQVESHPYLNQSKLIEFCTSHEIAVTAYSPLGAPYRSWAKPDEPSIMDDPRIKEIAEKHKKSPAQVLLRFNVQRGISTIPKSVTEERIRNNFEVFDFELTVEEMDLLSSFKENCRYCHLNWLKDLPNYPFNIEY